MPGSAPGQDDVFRILVFFFPLRRAARLAPGPGLIHDRRRKPEDGLSRKIAAALAATARMATAVLRPYRRAVTLALLRERLGETVAVDTPAGPLRFHSPTARSLHDTLRFEAGEPETIRWIDRLPAGSVLWDIGANVGVFALYAARRGHRVLAFEPGAASFATLVRNIEINGLGDAVDGYCLALDEAGPALGRLHMADTGAGHSWHSLDGLAAAGGAPAFRQAVPVCSVDHLVAAFGAPAPQHIKLDVDGLEERILRGARTALATSVRSLVVEINEAAPPGASAIHRLLAPLGFVEDADPAVAVARNTVFRRAP
jgi:FkbM family methyltransferase